MLYVVTLVFLLITVAVLLGLTAVAWRFRTRPGSKLFGVLQALSAIWAALTLVGLHLSEGPTRLRVWGLTTGLSLVVTIVWLGFILSYTGRDKFLTFRCFGVAALPLVAGAGLYFVVPSWPPLVGQLEQTTLSAGTVVQASIGPVGALLGLYIYLVFFAGLTVAIKTILESNSLFMGQGLALVLGSMVTIIASIVGIIGVPEAGYPTTAVALGGQSLLWGYAVFGKQLLQVVPAVATIGERAVFDNLDDGILVINDGGVITRTNPAARKYLDIDEGGGKNVTRILETMGVSDPADLPTRFQFQGLTYRATTSSITNWRGDTIGQTVVIQEVTLLSRRQQRLQVLNRILRHNVRNDMTVVRGLGNQLQHSNADELTAMGETVTERADDLITISEKAVELNQIFDREIKSEPVDLETVIEDSVSPLAAQHSDATIRLNLSADEVSTDAGVLSFVLKEVIANAVQHTGDHPEVLITAERKNDRFEITVTDDGPGIPQIELDTITAGEETDLQHASSLGLWTVHWGAQSLGGDVTFDTSESGTTVTVSLPEMPPRKTTSPSWDTNGQSGDRR